MSEEVLYEVGTVKITPARLVSGGSTYAVANITSVKAQTDHSRQIYGALAAVVGILLALTAKLLAVVLGALLIVVGVLLALFGEYTDVVITTGAAEQAAFRARDKKVALEVASAVNLAIMKRSARLER